MSVFVHRNNVKILKFSCLFQNHLKQMKTLTQLMWKQQYLRCDYTKFQLKIHIVFRYMLNFPRIPIFLANFTIGMIGNETGDLLKCVKPCRKFIKISETLALERGAT